MVIIKAKYASSSEKMIVILAGVSRSWRVKRKASFAEISDFMDSFKLKKIQDLQARCKKVDDCRISIGGKICTQDVVRAITKPTTALVALLVNCMGPLEADELDKAFINSHIEIFCMGIFRDE